MADELTVADLVGWLKSCAPLQLAEDWDNVGLLVGDSFRRVERVLTCLTLTADVAVEAIERRAQLVVTHHPLPFQPIKQLTAQTPAGEVLLPLVAAGIAVYSAHTAYDSAARGINQQLAERLGLTAIKPLRPYAEAAHPTSLADDIKLVCFVPESALRAVQDAVWAAGAGRIGEYEQCSFFGAGTGTFRGSEATSPAVGSAGRLEHVAELKLEVVCPKDRLLEVLVALRQAHPYEDPAIDLYERLPDPTSSREPLGSDQPDVMVGAGRCGVLPEPLSFGAVAARVGQMLGVASLQIVGDRQQMCRSVAIACGAGGEFLADAARLRCDVLLTGEARFHGCLDARRQGIGLILAGHYATERLGMEQLAAELQQAFPGIRCWASDREQDPVQMWTCDSTGR